MKTHLRSITKRKVSDFLLREEGMVGNRSAFATAALVSTTALAMALLVAPEVDAHPNGDWCGPVGYCNHNQICCFNHINVYKCAANVAAC